MAKARGRLINEKQIGPLVYSKRTIKKSGGDDFDNNIRSKRLKLKRKKVK